jgi:lipid II:glycine glycyltransferase (peptidoglycan interpeptide bridge formation enzyme)
MAPTLKAMPVPAFSPVTSAAAWQEALAKLPPAHALQSWTWGEFKSRWGWSASPLLLKNRAEAQIPVAAAMVLRRQLPGVPFSILYVPKGPVLDYRDGPSRRAVLAELEQLCRSERAIFIKIDPDVIVGWGVAPERPSADGHPFVEELQTRGWRFSTGQIQFRNTVQLALQRPEEELLAAMKAKTRYNIRLASRKGITVRSGTPADFPGIAAMYEETAARDGFAIRPRAYYLDIWRALFEAGMVQPLLAEFENEPVAAALIVHSGNNAIYMYGASTVKQRERMPNYLLQWEAIRWARSRGLETYDFWGAPDEFEESDRLWGVWRFKAGFQGQVVRHIGAWDYVVKPFWYWIYTVAMPRYLGLLRSRQGSNLG